MNKNRLSVEMQKGLNDQMTKEAFASQVYLSYAAWASGEGYGGVANFLFRHANEERNHMMKLLEYVLQRGGSVVINAIPAASEIPVNLNDCFEKILKQEVENTMGIYKLVKQSFEEEDWATWNFLQWFVKEQTEEETLALGLLDKIKIAGGVNATGEALYALDKELENKPDEETLAEDKTAINP
jgi:ferritin